MELLHTFHDQPQNLIMPAIPEGSFAKKLYSMYLSYLPKEKVAFDFSTTDYVLCITDTKGSHADLTHEYAAVPSEMKKIASLLGHGVLREITLDDILDNICMLRESAGDRAVLRAIHFVNETKRAHDEAMALQNEDLPKFLNLVRKSGDSSFKYQQ